MRSKVVVRAYVDMGALDIPCPTCGVAVAEYCTRTDDNGVVHERLIPCLARMQPLDVETVEDAEDISPAAFSEPVHPRAELW